jgi:hypothetical protein
MDKQDVFLIVCIFLYSQWRIQGRFWELHPPTPPLPRSISQDMFFKTVERYDT